MTSMQATNQTGPAEALLQPTDEQAPHDAAPHAAQAPGTHLPPAEPGAADSAPVWTGPVAAAQVLGAILRSLRQQRGDRLTAVAPLIRASVSKLSRLEAGASTPRPLDITDLLDIYKADDQSRADVEILMAMVKAGPDAHAQVDVAPGWCRRLTGFTAAAERVEHWAGVVVPLPLRTRRYMQALTASVPHQEQQQLQQLRHHNQRAQLIAKNPARTTALLDESVLHRPVGGPEVMAEQLTYLQHLAARGTDVRIVSAAARLTVPPTAVTRMTFGPIGPGDLVCVETDTSALYLTRPADRTPYQDVLNQLAAHAADHQTSTLLIESAIRLHEQQPASSTKGCQ